MNNIFLLGTLMFVVTINCQGIQTSKQTKYLLVEIEQDGEGDVGIGDSNGGNALT